MSTRTDITPADETPRDMVPQMASKWEAVVENVELFTKIKSRLIKENHVAYIPTWDPVKKTKVEKPFIKKSGWRVMALAFNIKDEIVKETIENVDGVWFVRYTARATEPGGRYCECVGACSSDETQVPKQYKDVLTTAQTRAKNRAIADLVGLGEVSAEEMPTNGYNAAGTVAKPPPQAKPKSTSGKSAEDVLCTCDKKILAKNGHSCGSCGKEFQKIMIDALRADGRIMK